MSVAFLASRRNCFFLGRGDQFFVQNMVVHQGGIFTSVTNSCIMGVTVRSLDYASPWCSTPTLHAGHGVLGASVAKLNIYNPFGGKEYIFDGEGTFRGWGYIGIFGSQLLHSVSMTSCLFLIQNLNHL